MVAPIFFASRTGDSYDGSPVTRCFDGDRKALAAAVNSGPEPVPSHTFSGFAPYILAMTSVSASMLSG